MSDEKKYISLVYEDDLSLAVMEKLLEKTSFQIQSRYDCHGYGKVKTHAPRYLNACRKLESFFFILTDLDQLECPVMLIQKWFGRSDFPSNFFFRVAVREVESWVMADRKALANFLWVSEARIPREPDTLKDPKNTLFEIAKKSRHREVREGIPPIDAFAPCGPLYNSLLVDFVKNYWSPEIAAESSPSLFRTIQKIQSCFDNKKKGRKK